MLSSRCRHAHTRWRTLAASRQTLVSATTTTTATRATSHSNAATTTQHITRLDGVPLSQPFRAVAWTCLRHRHPFQVNLVVPGDDTHKRGSRHPTYLAQNPAGTVPYALLPADLAGADEPYGLSECAAILTLLAQRLGWDDVLPRDALEASKVHAYAHWHHTNTRKLALAYWAPVVKAGFSSSAEVLAAAMADGHKALRLLDEWWLRDEAFIGGLPRASMADTMAYEEIVQLSPRYGNVLELTAYPRVLRWLDRMAALEYHEEAHAALAELGDLACGPADNRRLGAATKAGLKALAAAVEANSAS